MIEAWQIEHRPWLYFFLRRYELIRWTLTGKKLHPEAKWYALLLSLWLAITGYETERCNFCGWKVEQVWWCEDEIAWTTVTGYKGGGISCIKCFNKRASAKSLSLRWLATPLCGYTDEEWQRIIQENAEVLSREKEQTVKQEHETLPAEAARA